MEESKQKTINILMYGMRRTGKSSVLASMIGQFQEAAKGTPLQVTPTSGTAEVMRTKLIALEKTFYNADYLEQSCFLFHGDAEDDPSFTPTFDITPYYFNLTYQDGKETETIANLTFWDVPGEIYHSRDEERMAEVADKMKFCNILVIAVDTVHLMEEGGKYSQSFHSPRILHNLISEYWGEDEEKSTVPRLVLFVPLKCEKYCYNKSLSQVNERIRETFELPIDTLQKLPGSVSIAVTPILTMGSVEFDHFGRDNNGKVVYQSVWGMGKTVRPAQVYYRFTGNRSFAPRYCEQPVLYIFSFIIESTGRVKELEDQKKGKEKKRPFWKSVAEGGGLWFLFGIPSIAVYLVGRKLLGNKKVMTAYEKISLRLKKTGDGYEIIQDPLNL